MGGQVDDAHNTSINTLKNTKAHTYRVVRASGGLIGASSEKPSPIVYMGMMGWVQRTPSSFSQYLATFHAADLPDSNIPRKYFSHLPPSPFPLTLILSHPHPI